MNKPYTNCWFRRCICDGLQFDKEFSIFGIRGLKWRWHPSCCDLCCMLKQLTWLKYVSTLKSEQQLIKGGKSVSTFGVWVGSGGVTQVNRNHCDLLVITVAGEWVSDYSKRPSHSSIPWLSLERENDRCSRRHSETKMELMQGNGKKWGPRRGQGHWEAEALTMKSFQMRAGRAVSATVV